jgi:4-diphosphocytidyl-2-C-methyl-D-erythritol kinase
VEEGGAVRLALEAGDVTAVGRSLHNRLQEPAEELQPAVARLRQRLVECEPVGVLMSGSGSTVFAVGRDAADASRIARALHSRREVGEQTRVCVVRSCD